MSWIKHFNTIHLQMAKSLFGNMKSTCSKIIIPCIILQTIVYILYFTILSSRSYLMVDICSMQEKGDAMLVNISEAKKNLSSLIKLLETEKEEQVIITRYGKPVVKMVIHNETPVSKRIGVAKGKLNSPEDFDLYNDEITALLEEGME